MIDVIIRKRGLKIMRFTKMHGIGNDYVYVNCLEENVENPSELSIKVSDRHFGIGSDGLILIKHPKKQTLRWKCTMQMEVRVQCAEMESAAWQSMCMITV